MARIVEVTPEEEDAFRDWAEAAHPAVFALSKVVDPWSLYRMKATGQRVMVASFCEDATVVVRALGRLNNMAVDFEVFGVEVADLEPCDMPLELMPFEGGTVH